MVEFTSLVEMKYNIILDNIHTTPSSLKLSKACKDSIKEQS